MKHVTKDQRVTALADARSKLLVRFHRATVELEQSKSQLQIIDGQLAVMTGLVDPIEDSDGTN